MGKNLKIENVVILKSKFQLEFHRVFFGVAKLMPDRMVLRGLFYKRVILLTEIQEVRWSSNLVVLGLFGGEELEMIIQSAALWKYELQSRCNLTDLLIPLVEKGGGFSSIWINNRRSAHSQFECDKTVGVSTRIRLSGKRFKGHSARPRVFV